MKVLGEAQQRGLLVLLFTKLRKRATQKQKLKGYRLILCLIPAGCSLSRLPFGEGVLPPTAVWLLFLFVHFHSLNFSTLEANFPRVPILPCSVGCVGVRPVRAI